MMNAALVMSLALLGLEFELGMVRGDLNDPELYVADYYPQSQPQPQAVNSLHLPPYHYRYNYLDDDDDDNDYMRSDEPGYFVDYPTSTQYNNRALENNALEFLEKNGLQNDNPSDILNKRVLSSFRERMEREKSKEQQEKFAEMFLEKLQEEAVDRELEREYDNRDYIEMIENLWEKYKKSHSQSQYDKDAPMFVQGEAKKRQMQIQIPVDYSTLGWSAVGYRKRSDVDLVQSPDLYTNYPTEFLYAKRKRFPVAKRSSNFYTNNNKKANQKHLVAASGTDPKVVQDLSHIFVNKQNTTENKKVGSKKTLSSSSPSVQDTIAATANPHSQSHHHENGFVKDEPLNIQKKSIDWSNYFGIDRRKKKSQSFPNENEIDNDWLIKRYNKAVAMAVKRNSEYPLNIFRNHNTKKGSEMPETGENRKLEEKSDETKLKDMDDKLKNIEDVIIDEALKYTGAHEGETDPAEIQEVKDKVISRLAAAYSLEKMRRALSEFKSSLAAQKNEHDDDDDDEDKNGNNNKSGNRPEPEAERDVAVKKKSTKAERKCTSTSGCEGAGSNDIQVILATGTDTGGRCNFIENRCRRLMSGGGGYSGLFYSLCKWHQLCYLCQDDVDTGTCDLLLLSRADTLCHGDVVCQWATRPALAYLRQLQDVAPQQSQQPHCNRAAVCTR